MLKEKINKQMENMSPLDKLIMKTFKINVQILLEVRSSFIWNSADEDLRSIVPLCERICKLTTDHHNAHISIRIISHPSISISPPHSTAHGTLGVVFDSPPEKKEGSPFLDSFVSC